MVDEVLRRSWLRLLTEETLVIPNRSPIPVPGAREAYDVIGFAYRHRGGREGATACHALSPVGVRSAPTDRYLGRRGSVVAVHDLADALLDRGSPTRRRRDPHPDEGQREDCRARRWPTS